MLANYLQHQRRNKMEWIIGFVLIALLIVIFVVLQLIGILFLMDENKKISEELEKNSPPF
jgi:uncharacterized Rmd1/YagE family protein